MCSVEDLIVHAEIFKIIAVIDITINFIIIKGSIPTDFSLTIVGLQFWQQQEPNNREPEVRHR